MLAQHSIVYCPDTAYRVLIYDVIIVRRSINFFFVGAVAGTRHCDTFSRLSGLVLAIELEMRYCEGA